MKWEVVDDHKKGEVVEYQEKWKGVDDHEKQEVVEVIANKKLLQIIGSEKL